MPEVIPTDLLEMLCCPCCKGELGRATDLSELHCPGCDHRYPIVDGIPVLFPMDVKPRFEELFGRFWDSEEKAGIYDQFVEGHESMMGRHNHLGEVDATMEVIGPLAQERLLDCGCGNGRFFQHYPESVFVVGVDASLNLLRICRARGRCSRLVCCELEHLPFRDGSFDRTVSVRVLQHLDKQEQAVSEMMRVLETGGQTVIHCYNDLNTKAVAKRIQMSEFWQPLVNAPFRALHRGLSPFGPWGLDYDKYSTVPQIRRWIERYGGSVTRVHGTGFGFNKWLVDGFMIAARLEREHPDVLRRYLDWSFRLEQALGRVVPFSYVMEKFVVKGVKVAGS